MHKHLIFGLLACCLFSVSSAQSLIRLDEIVVSDNKLELPRATKTKRVIRLEAEELHRYAGQPLALVLNNLTGIEISGSRGAQGQNLGLYGRGGNNRQILALLDGLPINDPSQPASDFDLRLIDLSLQLFNALNTDYVEIIGFSTRGRNLSLAYQVRI